MSAKKFIAAIFRSYNLLPTKFVDRSIASREAGFDKVGCYFTSGLLVCLYHQFLFVLLYSSSAMTGGGNMFVAEHCVSLSFFVRFQIKIQNRHISYRYILSLFAAYFAVNRFAVFLFQP